MFLVENVLALLSALFNLTESINLAALISVWVFKLVSITLLLGALSLCSKGRALVITKVLGTKGSELLVGKGLDAKGSVVVLGIITLLAKGAGVLEKRRGLIE
ncbi:hypothetical protein DSO57_1013582 [Entomophthora muscae]|uniref:Uncharacterized protein n=1 Tax=Entomophthora muscae TaxID=34485 RepID=A0ACC2S7H2_9FUNG|nr:hypothetical protein DSO57_1013582 [Entomophthora muscae]